MAFQSSQNSNNVAPINSGNNGKNSVAPDAYINVSMLTRQGGQSGGTRKLIGIPFSAQKEFDKKILDFIADAPDQEAALRQLASRLVLDFKRADGSNGVEPDFGDPIESEETQAQA